ncbi:rod shape-determining protein RodA [bacterium]|nr:rod shape-determining protein RodA [bacterium]NBX48852.1 rod shape-determining protein RodA [bacterium]
MRHLSLARFDWWILVAVVLLFFMGLAAIGSVELSQSAGSFPFLRKQLIAAGLGIAGAVIILTRPAVALRQYARLAWLVALALLVLVLFFGQAYNNAKGWFELGGFAFQPIEWAKIAFVLYTASLLAEDDAYPLKRRTVFRVAVALFAAAVLVIRQPDLGGTVLLAGVAAMMLFFSGISLRWIAAGIGGAVLFTFLGWSFIFSQYQKDRIATFLDPTADPLGTGYNVNQAMVAIGSGGWLGRGFGGGSQSQLQFLPESQTDFIFAVIAEEFGFIGAAFVLGAFAFLLGRILLAAFSARDRFMRSFLFGGAALFLIPMVIHMGTNMAILPATGITLPLVSYGGSSLLMTILLLGMILRVIWEVRANSANTSEGI